MALVFVCFGACSSDSVNTDTLGSFTMPLTTTTAKHTYHINGSLQLFKDGVQVGQYDMSDDSTAVTIYAVKPGDYTVQLTVTEMLRDGVAFAYTMTSANPHPITVNAGETVHDTWQFNVAGDPVPFVCSATTCGDIAEHIHVTEVAPQ